MSGILGAMAQPEPLGGQIADVGGAYLAVMAILAALLERERSGQGAYLDVSLADAAVPFALMAWVETLVTGKESGPTSLTGALACYGVYETQDGQHVALAALESKFWHNFCRAVDRPDLEAGDHLDPARQADLCRELKALFASQTAAEWQDLLADANCCFSLLVATEQLDQVEQFQGRGNLGMSADGRPWIRSPLQVGDDFGAISVNVPGYGEHSREVLSEAGYTREEIDALVNARVIL